jgi:hypothetical protein
MSEFNAYEVTPDVEYADEGGDAYSDVPQSVLDYFTDEYGDLDEGALENFLENVAEEAGTLEQAHRQVHQREAEALAGDLESRYPMLREESGVRAVLESAHELLGIRQPVDSDELLGWVFDQPDAEDIIEAAVERASSGEGMFQKRWHDHQGSFDPDGGKGRQFFMGGSGGGVA